MATETKRRTKIQDVRESIWKNPGSNLRQLSVDTGHPWYTISRIASQLIDRGLVMQVYVRTQKQGNCTYYSTNEEGLPALKPMIEYEVD
jgi:tRNA A58 N-methylase Trm61